MFLDPSLAQLRQGLVGAWSPATTGPTGTSLLDLSGQNNHGTLTNMDAATDWPLDQYGYALDFDGVNDYVAGSDSTLPFGNPSVSLSQWILIKNTTPAGGVFGYGRTSGSLGAIKTYVNLRGSGVLSVEFGGNNTYVGPTLTTNTWEHIVVVKMPGIINSTTQIYRNGILQAMGGTSSSNTPSIATGSLTLGIFDLPGLDCSPCKIADVSIHKRALTEGEIQTLYRLGPGGLFKQKSPSRRKSKTFVFNFDQFRYPIVSTTLDKVSKEGLVGHWCPGITGATGTDLLDLSGQNNKGTLTNMDPPTDWVLSEKGLALDFDGVNDYVTMTQSPNIEGLRQVALTAWIYRPSSGSIQTFGYGTTSQKRVNIVWFSDNRVYCQVENGSATSYPNALANITGWHHLCMSFDGSLSASSRIKLFIDGVDTVLTSGGSDPGTTTQTGIGSFEINRELANNRYGNGRIAEVRLYNRALSAEEIQKLYSAGPGYKTKPKRRYFYKTSPNDLNAFRYPIHKENDWAKQGLVGHWCPSVTGATGTDLLDLSGQNNKGTLTNMDAPTDWVQTEKGLALDFDGANDQVLINDAPALNPTNAITVCLWYNSRSVPGSVTPFTYCLLSKSTSVNAQPYPTFDIRGSSTTAIEAAVAIGSTSKTVSLGTINTNQWTFVSFTYDGSVLAGYRNGLLQASSSQSGALGTTTSPLALGNNYGFSPRFFNGQISEVRLYNRALTAEEISKLYQGGPGFATKPKRRYFAKVAPSDLNRFQMPRVRVKDKQDLRRGLVGYWSPAATGPTGTDLLDLSGQNNKGTLTNMNAPTDWVLDRYGYALDFDGSDDFVSLSDLSIMDFGSSEFSFSVWLKPNNVTTRQVIFGKDSEVANGRQFGLAIKGGSNNGSLDGYWFQNNTNGRFAATSGNIVSTTWSHVIFQRKISTDIEIWLNGVSLAITISGSVAIDGSMQSGVADFCIGKRTYAGFNDPFSGQFAELVSFKRGLTPAEIATLYRLGPGGLAKPYNDRLRSWYPTQAAVIPPITGWKSYWARQKSRLIGAGSY